MDAWNVANAFALLWGVSWLVVAICAVRGDLAEKVRKFALRSERNLVVFAIALSVVCVAPLATSLFLQIPARHEEWARIASHPRAWILVNLEPGRETARDAVALVDRELAKYENSSVCGPGTLCSEAVRRLHEERREIEGIAWRDRLSR